MPIDRSQASALCVRPFTPAPASLAISRLLRRLMPMRLSESWVTVGPLPLLRMRRPWRSGWPFRRAPFLEGENGVIVLDQPLAKLPLLGAGLPKPLLALLLGFGLLGGGASRTARQFVFTERHCAASRMKARTPLIWRVRGLCALAAELGLKLFIRGINSRASNSTGSRLYDTCACTPVVGAQAVGDELPVHVPVRG